MKNDLLIITLVLLALPGQMSAQIPYPGEDPGQARINIISAGHVILENTAVRMEFIQDDKKIRISGFEDKETGYSLMTGPLPLFELILQDSSLLTSEDFNLVNSPLFVNDFGNETASTFAERQPGKKYTADLENKKAGLTL